MRILNRRIHQMEYNFTIGELVFTIRKINKLTQVDFSKRLGVVQSTISKVEKDIFDDVPFSLISKISTDFDIPLQNFQFGHLPTKKNSDVKNIIPPQYLESGIFKTKTVFAILNELKKEQGDKLFKDLKLPYQYLCLSGLKYSFEFINKLYSLTGEGLNQVIKKLSEELPNGNKVETSVISKYFKSTSGIQLVTPISEIPTGLSFTIKFDNHLSELNQIYANVLELELGLIFNSKVQFEEIENHHLKVTINVG